MSSLHSSKEFYTKSNLHLLMLKVSAQNRPDLTVQVNPGAFWFAGDYIEFEGGSSEQLQPPHSHAQYKVIALAIRNKKAVIDVIDGEISEDPKLPSIPKDEIPLAGILLQAGMSYITNNLITDLRPVFTAASSKSLVNVEDLAGVEIDTDSLDHNQLLVYDGYMQKWVNKTFAYSRVQHEVITLTYTNIANKQVSLKYEPIGYFDIKLSVSGGLEQVPGEDYEVDNNNPKVIKWNSMGLDGILEEGDQLLISYVTNDPET